MGQCGHRRGRGCNSTRKKSRQTFLNDECRWGGGKSYRPSEAKCDVRGPLLGRKETAAGKEHKPKQPHPPPPPNTPPTTKKPTPPPNPTPTPPPPQPPHQKKQPLLRHRIVYGVLLKNFQKIQNGGGARELSKTSGTCCKKGKYKAYGKVASRRGSRGLKA